MKKENKIREVSPKKKREDMIMGISFSVFQENLPKTKERYALGDEKMLGAFRCAVRKILELTQQVINKD